MRLREGLLRGILVVLFLAMPVLTAVSPAYAATADNLFEEVCDNGGDAAACKGGGSDPVTGSNSILSLVANIIAAVAGIAAVIIIVVGAISYMTSQGDSAKVQTAKNTIIYAAIGLLVIVLARSIIAFVVNRAIAL